MNLFRRLRFSLVLALFAVVSFAQAEEALPPARALGADLLSIFTLPSAEQPDAFRQTVLRHRDVVLEIAKANAPGATLLDESIFQLVGGVSEEQKAQARKAFDQVLKSPQFQVAASSVNAQTLAAIPDELLLRASEQGGRLLEKFSISSQPGFKKILDPKTGVNLKDKRMQKLVEEILPKFYDELPLKLKARIAAGVLRVPPGGSTAAQASAVLQNSGPLVQKLFQLLGGETTSPEMQEVMALLKANIQPVPREAIMAALEKRFGKEALEKSFADISKPISSGTLGQVQFATVRATGKEVAIKVRRPGVVDDFNFEAEVLKRVAASTDYADVADKIVSNISKELDFRIEAENLKQGEVYIDPKHRIGIAKRIEAFAPEEDVLVLMKAPGKTVDKITDPAHLIRRGEAVEDLMENWTRLSVFQDGFFHGDLHPGNIFLKITGDGPKDYQVTLLDFGNAGRITRTEQKGFLHLLTAVTLRSPEQMMAALNSLAGIPEKERASLMKELTRISQRKPTAPLHKWLTDMFKDIIDMSLQHDAKFPESFLSFNRGRTFLEQELEQVNKLLDKADPTRKLKRFDPTKAQVKAFLKETPSAVAANVLRRAEKEPVLSYKVLQDAVNSWRTSPYRKNVRGFCSDYYNVLANESTIPQAAF